LVPLILLGVVFGMLLDWDEDRNAIEIDAGRDVVARGELPAEISVNELFDGARPESCFREPPEHVGQVVGCNPFQSDAIVGSQEAHCTSGDRCLGSVVEGLKHDHVVEPSYELGSKAVTE
jgi:hypothetical protein